ncbi:hypothetical protein NGRA_3445, partial [Nosema granulosis]
GFNKERMKYFLIEFEWKKKNLKYSEKESIRKACCKILYSLKINPIDSYSYSYYYFFFGGGYKVLVSLETLYSIKKVLIVREDLTSSLIELIERIDVVYDDLYTWYPGLKDSDPCSFFIELVPNIIYKYKNYYTRSLLVGDNPKEKILDVLRNRMSKSLIDFDIIIKDMFIFNMKDNSEVKRSKKLVKNIVSKNYWTENVRILKMVH